MSVAPIAITSIPAKQPVNSSPCGPWSKQPLKNVQPSNELIRTLFNVRKNHLRMISDREYDISGEKVLYSYTVSDFEKVFKQKAASEGTTFRSALSSRYIKTVTTTSSDGTSVSSYEKTLVYYPETPDATRISKDQVRQLCEELDKQAPEQKPNVVVIITELPLSPDCWKVIEGLPQYQFQHFMYYDLSYIVVDHVMVPRHERISLEMKKAILSQPNMRNVDSLAGMSIEDPVTKWYNFHVGDLIRIHRTSFSIETPVTEYPSYRIVRRTPLVRQTSGKSATKKV